jgi:hypothetical protein
MQVFLVASSVAIAFWSAAMVRGREFARAGGIYGLILATATLITLLSGLMTRYEHLFGMVFVGQAIWFISAAVQMWRTEEA